MSRLGISDIVALAKSGFKVADIKELMSMEIPEASGDDEASKPDDKAAQPPTENTAEESVQDKAGAPEEDDNIDYKQLYEQKCEELKKAQNANVHQNQPETKPQTTLDDIVRSFM